MITPKTTCFDLPPDIVPATDERRCDNCDRYSFKIMAGDETSGKCFRDFTEENRHYWWVEGVMSCGRFTPDLPMRERMGKGER